MATGKYTYTPIKSVLTSTEKYHNIFGVIRKYHEQGVCIRDETYDSIKVDFSATFDAILPHIKPGNIIRIHRLVNNGNTTYRCMKVSDVLLFSSFKNKDAASYKVRFEAQQPTFEASDFARVAELEKWLTNKLLEVSLRTITMTTWYDLVCQVVDIKDLAHHRVVLIVYDGFNPGLRFNWLTPSEQWDGFPMEKLACITAWDRHAVKARKLEKGSIITLFNLQTSEAKLQPGLFELHLRGGTHYGKMIRVINPNSFLGVGFKTRMQQFRPETVTRTTGIQPNQQPNQQSNGRPQTIIEEIPDSVCNQTNNPAHSTQLLNTDDLIDANCDISDIGSSISEEESISPKNQPIPPKPQPIPSKNQPILLKPIIPAKKAKLSFDIQFPVIVDITEPEGLFGIKDYLTSNTNQRCCIKAKVTSYKPFSKNISDFIQLVCPNCNYNESPSSNEINSIRKSSGPRTLSPCPNCQRKGEIHQLNATFWINLYLSDVENYEIPVTLNKLCVNKLLGIRLISVLNENEEAKKIFNFLDYICPTIINLERSSSSSFSTSSPLLIASDQDNRPYLKWIIQRQPGGPQVQYEYQVLTVFPLD